MDEFYILGCDAMYSTSVNFNQKAWNRILEDSILQDSGEFTSVACCAELRVRQSSLKYQPLVQNGRFFGDLLL
jgi:hypothetical protein